MGELPEGLPETRELPPPETTLPSTDVSGRPPSRWSGVARHGRSALVLLFALAAAVPFCRYIGKSYAVGDWLAWPLLSVWGYALLFWLGNASLGLWVSKRWLNEGDESSLETLALALPLGLLAFNVTMYVGGALHLYKPWFGVGLSLAMLLAGARASWAFARDFRGRADLSPRSTASRLMSGLARAFGIAAIVLLYLQAMTPDAINFDASWSHLAIAQDYAREGRMVAFDADYTRCFPHLASVAHTYAFLAPLPKPALKWMLALHDELGAVLCTLIGVGALLERLAGRRVRGGFAAFFLFPGIFVYDLNIGGAADHYEALFIAPLVIAAFRAAGTTSVRSHIWVGLMAAGALSTKLQAIYLIVPVASLLFIEWIRLAVANYRSESGPRFKSLGTAARPVLRPAVAFAVALVLGISPHLVRNTIFHGNPVYPMALDVFRGSHPTVPRAGFLFEYLFKDWTWRPHGTLFENVKDALKLFFTFSFAPHYSFTHDVPEFGSLFTLTLPWLLLVRERKRMVIASLIAFVGLFMWGMTFRVDRHLTAFVPLLAASTGALLIRAWELGALARLGVTVLVGAQLAFSGDVVSYSGYQRIQSSLELIRSGYEGRAKTRFDNYRKVFLDMGAALPKDAVVVMHTYRPNLGIDRRIYMDWAGQQGLISYEPIRSPRELYDLYAKLGITHVIDMPDDRQSPSKQEDALFTTFLHRYGKNAKRFGTYEIVEVPKNPPPPDHPWRALSLGLGGYQDGIYPIEAMNTPDALPAPVRVYQAPAEPVDRTPEGMKRMIHEVDVILVMGPIDVALTHEIEGSFDKIASYAKGDTIYAKK